MNILRITNASALIPTSHRRPKSPRFTSIIHQRTGQKLALPDQPSRSLSKVIGLVCLMGCGAGVFLVVAAWVVRP